MAVLFLWFDGNSSSLFAVTNGNALLQYDKGWRQLTSNLIKTTIYSIKGVDDGIYIGTDLGLFKQTKVI